jgi:hypothetical protein
MVVDSAQVEGRVNVEANLARKIAPGRGERAGSDGILLRRRISAGSCRVAKDWRTVKQAGTAHFCGRHALQSS